MAENINITSNACLINLKHRNKFFTWHGNINTPFLTVSPRTIFHSFSGTIGWRLFPRRWRGNRRGKILFNPNGFHGIEGIFSSFFHSVIQYGAERDEAGTGTRRGDVTTCPVCGYWRDWNLTHACPLSSSFPLSLSPYPRVVGQP